MEVATKRIVEGHEDNQFGQISNQSLRTSAKLKSVMMCIGDKNGSDVTL